MTQAQRYKYPLQLPQSLKETAARLAMEDGVSLNQWIVSAVAQKIGAVETAEDFLKARAGMAKRGRSDTAAGRGAGCAAEAGGFGLTSTRTLPDRKGTRAKR